MTKKGTDKVYRIIITQADSSGKHKAMNLAKTFLGRKYLGFFGRLFSRLYRQGYDYRVSFAVLKITREKVKKQNKNNVCAKIRLGECEQFFPSFLLKAK